MRKNPYYRAFRVGKLTLAALEATLRLFRDLQKLADRHRVVGMLAMPVDLIRKRAQDLASRIHAECGPGFAADVVDGESEVGGGSLAGYSLPSALVRLKVEGLTAHELARQLRCARPSVFARIRDEALLMDLRTVLPGEESPIIEALRSISGAAGGG
jgi:L-seryl-tRNA(Ser) seleniumtransferase